MDLERNQNKVLGTPNYMLKAKLVPLMTILISR
jgi:hypothetical protein